MPGYSKLPRPTRMKFKDTTKTFLSDKLGSKAASEDCVIFIQNDGRKISTIGVPRDLEREYRAMALTELRRMFGFKGVPLQKFELDFAAPLDPIGSEKMDKINELVLSLSKAMRRFMRIRTRYISSLRLEAQTDSPGPLSGTNNTQIENAASHVSLECPELVQAMDLDGQMRNVSPDPDIVTADESTIEVIREDSVLQTLFEISSSPEEQETDENVHCIRGAPVEVDLTISSTPSPVTSHASTSSRASESATPPLTPSRSSKRKRSAVKTYAEPDSPKRAPRKSLESPTMTVPRSKSHSECKYSEEELRDLTRYTKYVWFAMLSN